MIKSLLPRKSNLKKTCTLEQPQDYRFCTITLREGTLYILQFIALAFLIGYLFYNSWIPALICTPFIPLFFKWKRIKKVRELKNDLYMQFRDAAHSLSVAMFAGYSVENSVTETISELKQIYAAEEPIMREFQRIRQQLKLNRNMEDLLCDLAYRSDIEDIHSFAEVFISAKRTGGNLPFVLRNAVITISEKMKTQQEIQTAIAGKRLEYKIMCCIPPGILFYIRLTSPEFLRHLYGNAVGIIVMSGCILIYILAAYMGYRIMDIQI